MKILNNNEMLEIHGGGFSLKILGAVIAGTITFLIGVVDGLIHPKSC